MGVSHWYRRLCLFFFCISIPAAASEISLCTSLLGPFQDLLPEESLSLDINQPMHNGGARFSDLIKQLGFDAVANSVEILNASSDPQRPIRDHENLILAMGKHLESSGLHLSERMEEPNKSQTYSVALARSIGGSRPHAFREFVEKLARLKVDVVLSTHTFRDDEGSWAYLNDNGKLYGSNGGGLEGGRRIIFGPPALQWFNDKINPVTVHEAVHLAFALQKKADIRGEKIDNALPPTFDIKYNSENVHRLRALKVYADEHGLDEFEAYLAKALIHLAIISPAIEDPNFWALSREEVRNLKYNLVYADNNSSMAFDLYMYDMAAFEKVIASLRHGDSSLRLSFIKSNDQSLLTTDSYEIEFSHAQAEFRLRSPLPRFESPTAIGNDFRVREQMIQLLQMQLDHYSKLFPVLGFSRARGDDLKEGLRGK